MSVRKKTINLGEIRSPDIIYHCNSGFHILRSRSRLMPQTHPSEPQPMIPKWQNFSQEVQRTGNPDQASNLWIGFSCLHPEISALMFYQSSVWTIFYALDAQKAWCSCNIFNQKKNNFSVFWWLESICWIAFYSVISLIPQIINILQHSWTAIQIPI